MQSAFAYSFKVWLTTILLAPALMLAIMQPSEHVSKLFLYPIFVLSAALFGLVPLALWAWLTGLLCRRLTSYVQIKALLSVIFVVLTAFTFFILSGFTLRWDMASFYAPHALVALLCIWAFPLPKHPSILYEKQNK